MNLLGFLHLILLYAWPTPIFLKNVTPHRSEVFPLWDGISNFIFSHPPPHPHLFILLRRCWYVMIYNIKRQAKKPLRIFPELRTYNSNVALWHSLCENSLNLPFIFIVARTFLKYRENISGGWWSLSTESDSRKPESTIRRLIADRDKWKPFSLVVELVGQYIRELIWAQKDVHDVERKWKL